MAKKLTVEITPAQARALVWAMNVFEMAYDGGTGFDDMDKDFDRAVRTLAGLYEAAAEYADKN